MVIKEASHDGIINDGSGIYRPRSNGKGIHLDSRTPQRTWLHGGQLQSHLWGQSRLHRTHILSYGRHGCRWDDEGISKGKTLGFVGENGSWRYWRNRGWELGNTTHHQRVGVLKLGFGKARLNQGSAKTRFVGPRFAKSKFRLFRVFFKFRFTELVF